MTTSMMQIPGGTNQLYAPVERAWEMYASFSMYPHEIRAGAPNPRKLTAASVRIAQPHQDGVGPPPVEAGDDAGHGADQGDEERRREPDRERRPGAVRELREDVPADVGGAEGKRWTRGLIGHQFVALRDRLLRVVRRD